MTLHKIPPLNKSKNGWPEVVLLANIYCTTLNLKLTVLSRIEPANERRRGATRTGQRECVRDAIPDGPGVHLVVHGREPVRRGSSRRPGDYKRLKV